MAENSAIEWTTHTWNPWRGCTKISAGCARCYAETLSGRNPQTLGVWGPNGTRVVAAEAQWKLPLKWDREAAWCGNPVCKSSAVGRTGGRCSCGLEVERPRVFCASLADVFEDWAGPMRFASQQYFDTDACVCHECGAWMHYASKECTPGCKCDRAPRRLTMQDVRARLFALIDATPHLDWLVLTKRPENVARMVPEYARTSPSTNYFFGDEAARRGLESGKPYESTHTVSGVGVHRPNLWLGTSVENQAAADERIPHLLRVPAAVRFLSCEPLLGPVDLLRVDAAGFGGPAGHKVDCIRKGYWSDGPLGFVNHSDMHDRFGPLHWVIVGGESGPGARPCDVEWIRSLVGQCRAAGVPAFVKQLGANAGELVSCGIAPGSITLDTYDMPGGEPDDTWHPLRLADKKGGDLSEFPADLRVREFPEARR